MLTEENKDAIARGNVSFFHSCLQSAAGRPRGEEGGETGGTVTDAFITSPELGGSP